MKRKNESFKHWCLIFVSSIVKRFDDENVNDGVFSFIFYFYVY